MNLQRLSFDSMPPLEVPFRFFISAPLFGFLVGLLLLQADGYEISSRWTQLFLTATHGLTLGFMLVTMLGALFQVLPVVLGVSMPKAKQLSKWVLWFLVIGIFHLMAGLYLVSQLFLIIAVCALLLALLVFLGSFFIAALSMQSSYSSWTIRLAATSLLITVSLGILLSSGWISPDWFSNFRQFTNIHLMWGFIGWTFLLVMGVSFQIIPMFYVTPDYPKWLTQWLPVSIFLQLIFVSLFYGNVNLGWLLAVSLTLTTAIYPIYTLYLINSRRRKSEDITLWFWQTAMVFYLLACVIFLLIIILPSNFLIQLELLLASCLLIGFAVTLITGMLLKIVPFLVWLNLQQAWIKNPSKRMPLSNMQQVIPNQLAKIQYYLLISMMLLIFLLMLGLVSHWLIPLCGLVMCINFGYLWLNLFKAKRLYLRLALSMDDAKSESTAVIPSSANPESSK